MNYVAAYDRLIERARNRLLEGYCERHHIVPRCMGGSDDPDNLVKLTAEEHFLAHLLLVKIHPSNYRLALAAKIMTTHDTPNRRGNKLYGWLRRRASEAMKQRWLEDPWPNHMIGKTHSDEAKAKISASTKKSMTAIKGREVHAYNLDGTFYASFPSLMECALHLGTNASNVKYTAEGRFAHSKGKMLRYQRVDQLPAYVKPKKKIMRSAEHEANLKKALQNCRAVCSICGVESNKSAITRYHKDCQRIRK